ncbi:MAG: hypothetical protein GY941_12280 [Planctomycetes bacterium]|nr:hypothetical protein [Planctomycetota bacterium]
MAAIQDVISALIIYLKAQSDISTLLGTRVFGLELPKSESVSMPLKAIVIVDSGSVRAADYSDISNARLDFRCYGETPFEARLVYRTLTPLLRELEKSVTDSTFLYSAVHTAGPFPFRDTETDWPVTIDTWLVSMQETIVT